MISAIGFLAVKYNSQEATIFPAVLSDMHSRASLVLERGNGQKEIFTAPY